MAGEVNVTAGRPRGMRVAVTPANGHDNDTSQLQGVLDGYLFEATLAN